METFKYAVGSVVTIALVTSIGLHGTQLGQFLKTSGTVFSGLLNTVEKG